jgi:hypothetical protein
MPAIIDKEQVASMFAALGAAALSDEPFPAMPVTSAEEYQLALLACYVLVRMARVVPTEKLLEQLRNADTVAPMTDPSAWLRNRDAVSQDRQVVEAAHRLVSVGDALRK